MALVDLAPAQTWSAMGVPGFAWRTAAATADFTKLVAAGASEFVYGFGGASPIYTSTNSGLSWVQASAPSNSWSCVAASADGSRLVAAATFYYDSGDYADSFYNSDGLIYTSSDFGVTWAVTRACPKKSVLRTAV